MKPSHITQAIAACIEINRPLFIWGPPGVGKSETVRAAAAARGVGLCDFRAALRDAVDIMGLPYTADYTPESGATVRATQYALPAGLPRDGEGILFLDEMNSAPPQTQAALYQLVLDRRVGDYVLPDGWRIVAAGNRQNDRGVVHRMPDPLVDRFIHVDYEVDGDDWTRWANNNGVHECVVGFAKFRPNLLHSHDTKRECHAFATPRGWADVSKILALDLGAGPVESSLIRGRVGDGAGGEFMAYLKLYRNMVSPDDVIANPKKADVPHDVCILYALAEALARRATVANIAAVLTYARRIPQEYAACLVSSMTRATPALCNTREYIQWASENG